jgi:hypothetical protein
MHQQLGIHGHSSLTGGGDLNASKKNLLVVYNRNGDLDLKLEYGAQTSCTTTDRLQQGGGKRVAATGANDHNPTS